MGETALYTSWLAEAHLLGGDLDQAAALAARTLQSSSVGSSRGDDRVMLLRSRLLHRVIGSRFQPR